jgi:hypothetical protein
MHSRCISTHTHTHTQEELSSDRRRELGRARERAAAIFANSIDAKIIAAEIDYYHHHFARCKQHIYEA